MQTSIAITTAACVNSPSFARRLAGFGPVICAMSAWLAIGVFSAKSAGAGPPTPSIPPLYHPLNDSSARVVMGFGAQWIANGCDNQRKLHAGVDLEATKGKAVYAMEAGTIRASFTTTEWKGCLVIEHSDANGNKYTTVYWHIDASVTSGKVTRGQKIGTVADIPGNTHLHVGLRTVPYDYKPQVNTDTGVPAQRGALPRTKGCADGNQWPEYFRRPL